MSRVEELHEKLYREGGFTVDNYFHHYAGTGYAVGGVLEARLPLLVLEIDVLDELLQTYRRFCFCQPGYLIGAWLGSNNAMAYVELVQIIQDRDAAINLARSRDQKSIYSFEQKEVILV